MKQDNLKAIFHLPGAFEHFPMYKKLIELMEEQPEAFKENIKIGSIYGAPGGIWNGGRVLLKSCYVTEELKNVLEFYESKNIPVRFTFTNCLLEEKHLADTYCNLVLDIFNTGHNEIICNSEILEGYLRNKYGDRYKYISSTTKCFSNENIQKKELLKNYHLVVLDYNHNNNFDFLKSLDKNQIAKTELLCNSSCQPGCPNRLVHYQQVSLSQLDFTMFQQLDQCPVGGREMYYKAKKLSTYISPYDIFNEYLPLGFQNFKLEGRAAGPINLSEILTDYLVKPEYQLEIRQKLHTVFS